MNCPNCNKQITPEYCCYNCGHRWGAAMPEPMQEEPENGVTIYIVDIFSKNVLKIKWKSFHNSCLTSLNAGLCHTTREAAQAWLDWWNEAVGRAEARKD